jgi:serine-type D-Ala-D-Ala carboxypeptidase/endopeptidase (penicillin-binding protein 4)
VRMENGSGLSRADRAAPRQVGGLLVAMSRQPDHRAYRLSLPLAGHEGTVAHRMNGTPADGRCRTKTGTLIGVSALSGYCHAGHGLVAFSTLFNSVDVNAAESVEDRIAGLIAAYRP